MELPKLKDAFDGLHSWGWHGEEESDRKARIEALKHELSDCSGNIWEQMHRLRSFYCESDLDRKVRDAALGKLKENNQILFAWIMELPYPGMQYKMVELLSRQKQLGAFLQYAVGQENPNTFVILCAYSIYISDIESQLAATYGESEEQLAHIRDEGMGTILQGLTQLDAESYLIVSLTILSNEWIMDEDKYPCAFLSRNQIAKQVVDKFATTEKAREILHRQEWTEGRAGIFGRLKLLIEWECNKGFDLREEYSYLWDCLHSWLVKEDTYIFFGQSRENDNLMLLWFTAYLLHMELNPAKKFKELLSGYDVRMDGWRSDISMNLHRRQQRYFLLTVGAMAAEWLNNDDKRNEAYPLYKLVCEEGILALCSYNDTTEHETNFWAQYWARAKMLIPPPKYDEAKDMLVKCFRELYLPDDMLTITEQMIGNADATFVKAFFNREFTDEILQIIEEELKFREHENEFFEKRIKIGWHRYRDLSRRLLVKECKD